MKKLVLVLIVFSLYGCTNGKKDVEQTNVDSTQKVVDNKPSFNKYINSLDQIPLPLKHSTKDNFSILSSNYDELGFQKFKYSSSYKPLGVLFKSDKYVVTMEFSVGDAWLVPFIVSYKLNGDKIDSFSPFEKSGFSEGYKGIEYMTIDKDKTIVVVDSIIKWDLTEDLDTIPGTERLTVDTTYYRVLDEGKIKKY